MTLYCISLMFYVVTAAVQCGPCAPASSPPGTEQPRHPRHDTHNSPGAAL